MFFLGALFTWVTLYFCKNLNLENVSLTIFGLVFLSYILWAICVSDISNLNFVRNTTLENYYAFTIGIVLSVVIRNWSIWAEIE